MNIKPIRTKADHKEALERVEVLWNAVPNTPQGDELDVLATLIEVYEDKHCNYELVEPSGIEPLTSTLPVLRSPS